jgi:hypothetical protein
MPHSTLRPLEARDRPVVNRALGGGPSEVDGASLAD